MQKQKGHAYRQAGIITIILVIIIIALLATAGYFGYKYYTEKSEILNSKSETNSNTQSSSSQNFSQNAETAGWKTYLGVFSKGSYSFKYPEKVYGAQNWPPEVTVIDQNVANYSCPQLPSGSKFAEGYGEQKEIIVNGNKYCFTSASQGTAGSSYTTYKYTTFKDGEMLIFKFVIGYVDCGVYDEPKMSACSQEQNTFNSQLNSLIDQVISTFKFTPVK